MTMIHFPSFKHASKLSNCQCLLLLLIQLTETFLLLQCVAGQVVGTYSSALPEFMPRCHDSGSKPCGGAAAVAVFALCGPSDPGPRGADAHYLR